MGAAKKPAKKANKDDLKCIARSVFTDKKGTDHPMIVFRLDDSDRYGFQFGYGKAGKLLNAIKEHGVEVFAAKLEEFVNSQDNDETAEEAAA